MLDKYQLAELKDLYTPLGWGGVREMAKHFKVGVGVVAWAINYKNYKTKQKKRVENWKMKNKERWAKWQKEYSKEYHQKPKNKKRIRENTRKRYWKNPEKYRKMRRKWYKKKNCRQ